MSARVSVSLDLLSVLVFVTVGRSVHNHGLSLDGLASTAWPFASGLAAGWVAIAWMRRPGTSVFAGLLGCVCTVAIGMALRVISGQGTAVAFVGVALGFFGLTMLGWRFVLASYRRISRGGRIPR